jgi:arylsulfatase A-like enzyme
LAARGQEGRPNIIFAIADDWGYPHAGAYGYAAARTPTFDRLAKEGMLFTRAFSAAPSCTASRGSILTGQAPHRLENGGNLWSELPTKFAVYPQIL